MSTFTVSKNLEQVPRGGDLGTWDTPENSNWAVVDAALGQSVTIPLNNSNVVLSSPQFQCNTIIFNSTLTGSVIISFPSTFSGPYIIQNLCTGTSAFTITLATTVAGGQVIGAIFGEPFDVINDGTNLKYKGLGHVGTYWDYCGATLPNWVAACTVPPYLYCDGSTFSAATYPALAIILGSTTLPDSRGRVRAGLETGGTTRLNGIIANTVGAGGGDQNLQVHSHSINDPQHQHGLSPALTAPAAGQVNAGGQFTVVTAGVNNLTNNAPTGITINSAGAGGSQNVQPTYRGGITMVRAG